MSGTRSVSPMIIRPTAELRLWIETRAKENGRSMASEIIEAIREMMKRDPLHIFVNECAAPHGTVFTASVGTHGDDFFEGESREAAFAAAQIMAKKFGLSRAAIRFKTEDLAEASMPRTT